MHYYCRKYILRNLIRTLNNLFSNQIYSVILLKGLNYKFDFRVWKNVLLHIPYMVWSIPYMVWSIPYMVWSIPYMVWSIPYMVWSIPYMVWSIPYMVWSPLRMSHGFHLIWVCWHQIFVKVSCYFMRQLSKYHIIGHMVMSNEVIKHIKMSCDRSHDFSCHKT